MTAEQLVPDVETCIKLKDAGFPQDTIFYWLHNKLKDKWEITSCVTDCVKNHPESWEFIAAAPFMEEILEELPLVLNTKGTDYYLEITKGKGYEFSYVCYQGAELDDWLYPNFLPLPALYLALKKQGVI